MRRLRRKMPMLVAFLLTLVIALSLAEIFVPPKEAEAASRFSPPFPTAVKTVPTKTVNVVWAGKGGRPTVCVADSKGNVGWSGDNDAQVLCYDQTRDEILYAKWTYRSVSDKYYYKLTVWSASRGTIETAEREYESSSAPILIGIGVTNSGEIQVAFFCRPTVTIREWYYAYSAAEVCRLNGNTLQTVFRISSTEDRWFTTQNYKEIPNLAVMLPDGTWGFNSSVYSWIYGVNWEILYRKPDGTITATHLKTGWDDYAPLAVVGGKIVVAPLTSGDAVFDGKPLTWTTTGQIEFKFDNQSLINMPISLQPVPSDGKGYSYNRRIEVYAVSGPRPMIQLNQIIECWDNDGYARLREETWYTKVYPVVLANDQTFVAIDESGTSRKVYYQGSRSGTPEAYKWNGSDWTQTAYPLTDPLHNEGTYCIVVWYTASVPWMTEPVSISSGASGTWNGNVWVQLQWGTGKTIQMYDGYALRTIATNVSTWNSDSSAGKIMPDKAFLASLPDRTATGSLLMLPNTGHSLYDTPNLLYKKMAKPSTPAPDGFADYLGRPNYLFNVTGGHGFLISWTPHSNTDITPPVITNLIVNDGMYSAVTHSVPVVVQATDSQSGLGSVKVSTNGSIWTTYTWGSPISVLLAPGVNHVVVIVVDKVGNESEPAQQQVYYSVDTSPPELEISGPTFVSGNTLPLTISARDDKSSAMYLEQRYQYWNGSTWTYSAWASINAEVNIPIRPVDGVYTIPIQVRDQAGNVTQMLWRVTRSSSPTGSASSASGVEAPESLRTRYGLNANARLVSSNIVELTLTAPAGETSVSYSLDRINWSPKEPIPSGPISIVLPPGDGPKTIFVRFGERVPTAFQYIVDTTPPNLKVWWLGGATIAPSGMATLVVDASDNLTPPDQLEISYNGGATWEPYVASKAVTLSGSGYKPLVVQVRDQAGNISQQVLEILVP